MAADGCAGARARVSRRDDRRGPLRQHVEEGRFAGVGRAEDGDAHALAHDLAASAVGQPPRHLDPQLAHAADGGAERVGRDVFRILAEVDQRLCVRERAEQPLPPLLVLAALLAAHLRQRLLPLLVRVRVDQVREALHLRLPRKLARLGHPQPRDRAERLERRAHDGAAAVRVQFHDVLPRERPRRWEPERQYLINELTRARRAVGSVTARAIAVVQRRVAGPAQLTEHRTPRRRKLVRLRSGSHAEENLPRVRPGDAHDRDAGAAGAGREREDGVGIDGARQIRAEVQPPAARHVRHARREPRRAARCHAHERLHDVFSSTMLD
eukprot:1524787-Prymnesium_polylepis.1